MIKEAKLIAWDEAPMMHCHCIEVVDNTLRDIMGRVDSSLEHLPFGGKLVLFGGDLRQQLPVIRASGRSTVVNACITKSSAWKHITKKKLTVNMREKIARLQGMLDQVMHLHIAMHILVWSPHIWYLQHSRLHVM